MTTMIDFFGPINLVQKCLVGPIKRFIGALEMIRCAFLYNEFLFYGLFLLSLCKNV